ncbi:hypothetical protein LOTGIDRAFT_154284 [Lottia gigantea]|uniref:Uncharacterized protein n=1 Tax=Lottia gigantea TaxID=225164 RepID=V4A2M7_LOTGI|nr:hypothetical protein LOTGIDRAFT_154284 [Lottia gigantea]ESO89195.1 hypothetical protein LOTGIDRAFT_154284 [Lottia gigantea]
MSEEKEVFARQIREGRQKAEASDLGYPEVKLTEDDVYIVTGANTGIGYEVAKNIARMGAKVILACRNMTKAEKAIQQMQMEYEKSFEESSRSGEPITLNVVKMELDLSSFDSTMKFIETFKAQYSNLKGLICNAGVVTTERELTKDGNEIMFQVNFLSQFVLNLHFLPLLLKNGNDSRITLVSSDSYIEGAIEFDNMNCEKQFLSTFNVYGKSKLCQVMSTYWLSRHLKNKSVTITACNPGFIQTQMTAALDMLNPYMDQTLSPEVGAKTVIKAATSPEYKGQTALFFDNCQPIPTTDYARDEKLQEKLIQYVMGILKPYLPKNLEDYIEC